MKVVCAFKLPDVTVTETMTAEEIDQIIEKYNLQNKDIRNIFYNYISVLTEVTYDVEAYSLILLIEKEDNLLGKSQTIFDSIINKEKAKFD